MIAFDPNGPLLSVIAGSDATSAAPVAVQAITLDNVQTSQIKIVNTDATNDAVVAWGPNPAQAAFNAVVANASPNCTYLLHDSYDIITVPSDSWVTAVSAAGSPVIKVQAGYGKK